MTQPLTEFELKITLDAEKDSEEVVWSILEEAVKRAERRARANAPIGKSGRLQSSHFIRLDKAKSVVYLGNSVEYAEYVLPQGWKGRWRWFLRRCLRDATEEVARERSQQVADGVLKMLGPAARVSKSIKPSARDTGTARTRGGGRTLTAYERATGR